MRTLSNLLLQILTEEAVAMEAGGLFQYFTTLTVTLIITNQFFYTTWVTLQVGETNEEMHCWISTPRTSIFRGIYKGEPFQNSQPTGPITTAA